ncbi:hypothetical protein JL722_7730 [Aureococcus anophagefferens]|nr:hypothetical protein JL722_7730 [Aureococcus anophagefferens]
MFSGTRRREAGPARRGGPSRARLARRRDAAALRRRATRSSHAPPISEAAVAGPAGRRGVEIFEAAARPTDRRVPRDLADAAARASGRRLPSRKIDALTPLPRARLAAAARPKPVVRSSKKKLPISTSKTRRNAQRPDAAVRAAAVDVLGTSVSWDAPIFQQGLDSVSAAEFSRVLGDRLGSAVPATLLFDHPTVRDASRAVAGAAAPENECSQAPVRPVSSPASSRTEVARHRCERDHGELAARCLAAAGRVPSARWDVAAGGDAATYGSFVRLRADAGGLVGRLEAAAMSPAAAVALGRAVELRPAAPSVAVFLGAGATLGATTGGAAMPLSVFSGTSAALSVASGRVSALGLAAPR